MVEQEDGHVEEGVARVGNIFISISPLPETQPQFGWLHLVDRYVMLLDVDAQQKEFIWPGALVLSHPTAFLEVLKIANNALKLASIAVDSYHPATPACAEVPHKKLIGKVSLIGSCCQTCVVLPKCVAAHKHKLSSTWGSKAHPVMGVFATPIEIAKQLGFEADHHGPENATSGTSLKSRQVKGRSKSQSAHQDGQLEEALGDEPSFLSAIIPITGDANLRVWDYSHDMTELLADVTSRNSQVRKWNDDPSGAGEELVANWIDGHAPIGSVMANQQRIPAKTIRVPLGSSTVFLPHFYHAGSAMAREALEMCYRMHIYVLLPGDRGFVHGGANHCHAFMRRYLESWEGGDGKI